MIPVLLTAGKREENPPRRILTLRWVRELVSAENIYRLFERWVKDLSHTWTRAFRFSNLPLKINIRRYVVFYWLLPFSEKRRFWSMSVQKELTFYWRYALILFPTLSFCIIGCIVFQFKQNFSEYASELFLHSVVKC